MGLQENLVKYGLQLGSVILSDEVPKDKVEDLIEILLESVEENLPDSIDVAGVEVLMTMVTDLVFPQIRDGVLELFMALQPSMVEVRAGKDVDVSWDIK